MKKNFLCAVLCLAAGVFAQGVPQDFGGIWERGDRFVMFAPDEHISILLKTFYGWHLDRTAEGVLFDGRERSLNNSTTKIPERIRVEYRRVLPEQGGASVWELLVYYPGQKEAVVVPAAIIGSNLYLNFAVKAGAGVVGVEQDDAEDFPLDLQDDPLLGFWRSVSPADAIKVSPPHFSDNIYSTCITRDAVYTIRYWLTTMEYSDEKAWFYDGDNRFEVAKHIQSAGRVYTCTTGRSVTIRNVQKSAARPTVYELDEAALVCGLGEPYLKRVIEENTVDAVMALVDEAASRRAPNPNPPFPPSNLDFRMDDIRRLEKGNPIIEALRERNKNFGVLQKDAE